MGSQTPARALIETSLEKLERLDRAVSGSLAVARSGNVEQRVIDLRDPVRSATSDATPVFEAAGARLDLALPRTPVPVCGDATALHRLLLNLLLNAAQSLGHGGSASVRLASTDDEAVIAVIDTGCGIPPSQLEHVFDRFHTTRPNGGGLGLPIARQLAQVHGGRVELQSEPGRGTTARVLLPLARASSSPRT